MSDMFYWEWENQNSWKKQNQQAPNLPFVNYFAFQQMFVTVVRRMPIQA